MPKTRRAVLGPTHLRPAHCPGHATEAHSAEANPQTAEMALTSRLKLLFDFKMLTGLTSEDLNTFTGHVVEAT